MKWLPPKTTATISRCELFGRTMKSGFISGRHRSPKKGNSVEFAEHRQYMPGDDLRTLDWKVLGRKDRLYIRQYEEETNLRTTILLDCSGSMAYDGDAAAEVDGKKLSKFDYARYLVAGLTYMLAGQQDAVGLVTFDTKIREYLPAKSSASQTRRILEFLDKSKPGGETDPAPVINDIAERIPSRGFVIVVSDLFTSDPDELVKEPAALGEAVDASYGAIACGRRTVNAHAHRRRVERLEQSSDLRGHQDSVRDEVERHPLFLD